MESVCQFLPMNSNLFCFDTSFSLMNEGSFFGFVFFLSSHWSLFFLLPVLPASTSQGFTFHQRIPSISATTVNPAQYAGAVENTQLRKALTKTHGVLMIVAWPVLAGTAVLFAAFLKPVLKEGKWFQVRHVLSRGLVSSEINTTLCFLIFPPSIPPSLPPSFPLSIPRFPPLFSQPPSFPLVPPQVHRAIMLTSLLVGVCAFILVFIAHKDSTPAGLIVLTKVRWLFSKRVQQACSTHVSFVHVAKN